MRTEKRRNRIDFKVEPDVRHPETHTTVKVYVRGLVYACGWAGFPSEGQVLDARREDRRSFRPYDESEGAYCAMKTIGQS